MKQFAITSIVTKQRKLQIVEIPCYKLQITILNDFSEALGKECKNMDVDAKQPAHVIPEKKKYKKDISTLKQVQGRNSATSGNMETCDMQLYRTIDKDFLEEERLEEDRYMYLHISNGTYFPRDMRRYTLLRLRNEENEDKKRMVWIVQRKKCEDLFQLTADTTFDILHGRILFYRKKETEASKNQLTSTDDSINALNMQEETNNRDKKILASAQQMDTFATHDETTQGTSTDTRNIFPSQNNQNSLAESHNENFGSNEMHMGTQPNGENDSFDITNLNFDDIDLEEQPQWDLSLDGGNLPIYLPGDQDTTSQEARNYRHYNEDDSEDNGHGNPDNDSKSCTSSNKLDLGNGEKNSNNIHDDTRISNGVDSISVHTSQENTQEEGVERDVTYQTPGSTTWTNIDATEENKDQGGKSKVSATANANPERNNDPTESQSNPSNRHGSILGNSPRKKRAHSAVNDPKLISECMRKGGSNK